MVKLTNGRWKGWARFSFRTMMVVTTLICVCLAIWVHQSRRQLEAVAALRAIGYCKVYYDFDPEGPYPELQRTLNPAAVPDQPGWASELLGIDYFHEAVKAFVGTDDVDLALPHLTQLPGLRIVYVWNNGNGEGESTESTVKRLRKALPGVKVEIYHTHGLFISTIPVVG